MFGFIRDLLPTSWFAAKPVAMPPTVAATAPVGAGGGNASFTPIDVSKLTGSLKDIEYLSLSLGMKDESRSEILLIDRLNDALHVVPEPMALAAQISLRNKQKEWRGQLAGASVAELAQKGFFQETLTTYLGALRDEQLAQLTALKTVDAPDSQASQTFRTEGARIKAQMESLDQELGYYRGNPQVIRDLAVKQQALLSADTYLPVATIAARSGLVDADAAVAADLVNDVLARKGAREAKQMGVLFGEQEFLNLYRKLPDQHAAQIKALAETLADKSTSLSALPVNEKETPGLDMMQSLSGLMNAHLQAVASLDLTSGAMIETLTKAQSMQKEYAGVMQSLALSFLGTGAATNDARIQTMAGQLADEMRRDGIAPLPPEAALAKARGLATNSARELLKLTAGEPELEAKIRNHAFMAGVADAESLSPASVLVSQEQSQPRVMKAAAASAPGVGVTRH